ncbi:MAG: acyl-CoA dehydrogenase [Desulfomonile tiedjei]|uniref:3-methylmercaptopropionyl-CoA dehydrogenase n=1 Tax=Desulfomonile tiedjei TaxID=2358 RepID=A0A9D6Z2K7_9BACT|nr:acyl-CoA dehydrogenase [Desulfomonile tiedjei]
MANLLVDERDLKFVLYEQLSIENLCKADKYSEFSRETFDMMLDAAQKLAENELWPVNAIGDKIGVRLEDGQVRVPESFHKAYRHYCDGGWFGLSVDPKHDGQGFPISLAAAAIELFAAANLGFMGVPGLTVAAARVIQVFGSDVQRETYMRKMYAGEWGGTMCLTEPHAGSDVGALRTTATKNPDGTYSIVGNKIFITYGDHDLAENIVHLVLARVKGAPPGTKGISIFIVPKKRLENGTLADNDVTTAGIEEKMGLHASPTCALNFGEKDNCLGYLIGRENSGMPIMFQMMNESRLGVALQGLALASAAYMQSLRYAQDRVQGPHFAAMKDPAAPKVSIIEHPDVRRMLMWMKSVTEGMRSLLYFVANCEDMANVAKDDNEVSKYKGLIDLLIPVCKAWSSDVGFRVTEQAVQIHGGYGYCSEYPVEQFLRDIKITSIYEGANGIQALDLVGRKLSMNQGALFKNFLAIMEETSAKSRQNPRLHRIVDLFDVAKSQLVEATVYFATKAMSGETTIPVLYATPYLDLFGDVTIGYMLLWQAEIADGKLQDIYEEAGANTTEKKNELLIVNKEAAFYRGKIASAEFFSNSVLSLAKGKASAIMSGELSAVEIPRECFLRS